MALRLISFIIGMVLFTGFLGFFFRVMYLGLVEFFKPRETPSESPKMLKPSIKNIPKKNLDME